MLRAQQSVSARAHGWLQTQNSDSTLAEAVLASRMGSSGPLRTAGVLLAREQHTGQGLKAPSLAEVQSLDGSV